MSCQRSNFIWVGSDEPHATRRKLILEKYPEIKELMTIDTTFKWRVLLVVALQFLVYYLISDITNWFYLILISYFYIGTSTHCLFLGAHELVHGQGFGHNSPKLTYLWLVLCNLPVGISQSFTLRRYHLLHHKYQGDQEIDFDLPTDLEAKYINSRCRKLIFITFQGIIYSLRPMILNTFSTVTLEKDEIIGWIIQLIADYFIYKFFGLNVLICMFLGIWFGTSLHPSTGHFVSEHYVLDENPKDLGSKLDPKSTDNFDLIPETRSYYGPMNYVQWNIGYHIEHHDFPSIPGSKLHMVRKIAPEFYDFPHHTSMIKVLYNFIMNDQVTLFNRVKRNIIHKDVDHKRG